MPPDGKQMSISMYTVSGKKKPPRESIYLPKHKYNVIIQYYTL